MSEGGPDLAKVDPLIFITGVKKAYFRIGEKVASAFEVGKQIRKQ
jgi:hypothetical protein